MDISLALGGGGSRGYAHIGVLRCLEKQGFRIRAIAGTSAGGIIAIAYAAGYTPDEMESRFSALDQSKLFARSSSDGPGLLGFSGASHFLEGFFGNLTFSDLHIPCAVVAVDLQARREVVLNQGSVVDAILATGAVPGIFPPKKYGETQLVDGAVLNPVPVSVARLMAPTLPVVAVVLEMLTEVRGSFGSLPLPVPVPSIFVERLTRTRIAQAFNIFIRSVDVGSRKLAELRLLIDNPEVVIRPDVGEIGLLDKVDVHRIIKNGETAVAAVLPELRKVGRWSNRLRRLIFRRH